MHTPLLIEAFWDCLQCNETKTQVPSHQIFTSGQEQSISFSKALQASGNRAHRWQGSLPEVSGRTFWEIVAHDRRRHELDLVDGASAHELADNLHRDAVGRVLHGKLEGGVRQLCRGNLIVARGGRVPGFRPHKDARIQKTLRKQSHNLQLAKVG